MSGGLLGEGYDDSSSDEAENGALTKGGAPQPDSVDCSYTTINKETQHVTSAEDVVNSDVEKKVELDSNEISTFLRAIREQSPLIDDVSGEWRLLDTWREVKCGTTHITSIDTPFRGNKLVIGDFGGNVRLYDFHTMDLEGERYMEIRLPTTRPIEAIKFSATGNNLLISDGERTAHIYNAIQLTHIIDTYKGDIYVRDAANTTGHTHQIYDALWHPDNINIFATSSLDGTVRLWDITSPPQGLDHALVNLLVLKTVNSRGSSISQDCPVYSIAFLSDHEIIGGCKDGSIHLWEARISAIKSRKPMKTLRNFVDEPIMRVGASYGKGFFHARSEHWLMLFDRSKLQGVIKKIPVSPGSSKACTLTYMDFGRIVLTSSYDDKIEQPLICLYLADTLESITTMSLPPGTGKVTALSYNESLKQLFVGCESGTLLCFYHPEISSGGIMNVSTEKKSKVKASHTLEGAATDESKLTFSWYELPSNIKQMKDGTLKEVKPRRFQLRAERNPSMAAAGADEPILKRTMAETVMKKFLRAEAEQRGGNGSDWVEEVRRGEGLGSKLYGDISIVEKAYKRTQPEAILDTADDQDAGEALLTGERKCPQCGLKMCTCGYLEMIRGRLETGKVLQKHRRIV